MGFGLCVISHLEIFFFWGMVLKDLHCMTIDKREFLHIYANGWGRAELSGIWRKRKNSTLLVITAKKDFQV